MIKSGRCFIIGEIAQAHDGSLGTAHAYIDAIAESGADAVKFQTHIAAFESTPGEPWRVKFSRQDVSRYDYWKRMEFAEAHWQGLKEHANERGLLFISSPFSSEAVDLLQRTGIDAWKVASGEVSNLALVEKMAATGIPVLLSSGMSPMGELDRTVEAVRSRGKLMGMLQCTSAYPCPPELVGLNQLQLLSDRYHCPVGLSDHSGTIYAGLAAAALGAEIIEIHVTFSREMFGPDVPASLTTSELRQLVEGVRFTEKMLENPVDKDGMAQELAPLRDLFTKSVVAKIDLDAGTLLNPEVLAAKKPGTGIPASRIPDLLGRRLKRAVAADTLLSEDDFE